MKERGLDATQLEIGYNNTTWEQMRYCLVFALKSKEGKTVSLYGRNIYNTIQQRIGEDQTAGRHYYTRNRKGLYPFYPKADTEYSGVFDPPIPGMVSRMWIHPQ